MAAFTNWYDNGQYGYMGFGPMPNRRITLTITFDAQAGPLYCGQAASWGICAYDPLDKTRYAVYLGNPLNEVYTDGESYMLVNVSHQTVTADITTANPSDWDFHGGLTSVEGCALCIITYTGSGMTTGTSPCGSDFAAIDSRFTGCFTYEINTTRFAYLIDDCPIYAKRAECDQYGDNIEQTYLKKADETPQVQSDWTQADNTLPSYILHKPSIKPLVAGTGVRLLDDITNNRYVVEDDETVLYDNGSPSQIISDTSLTLSESYLHFERIKLYLRASGGSNTQGSYIVESPVYQSENTEVSALAVVNAIGSVMYDQNVFLFNTTAPTTCSAKSNGTRLNIASSGITTTASRGARLYRIVGVNRIAGN